MRKVLVTGAGGFIGRHLVSELEARGVEINCLVRSNGNVSHNGKNGVTLFQGDIFDSSVVRKAVDGVDYIFNLIGGGSVSTSTEKGYEDLVRRNVDTLEALLKVVRGQSIRNIVHFSSISAMGVQPNVLLTEDSPCVPAAPHEMAKLKSEELALRACKEWDIPITILRPVQVYGPEDPKSELTRLTGLVKRGIMPLFGGGKGLVPWVYVSDVVQASILAAENEISIGKTYIVSDKSPYVFREVVDTIARHLGVKRAGINVPIWAAYPAVGASELVFRVLGREPVFTLHRLQSITSKRIVSIERAQKELGYQPRMTMTEGMGETVRWIIDNGYV